MTNSHAILKIIFSYLIKSVTFSHRNIANIVLAEKKIHIHLATKKFLKMGNFQKIGNPDVISTFSITNLGIVNLLFKWWHKSLFFYQLKFILLEVRVYSEMRGKSNILNDFSGASGPLSGRLSMFSMRSSTRALLLPRTAMFPLFLPFVLATTTPARRLPPPQAADAQL